MPIPHSYLTGFNEKFRQPLPRFRTTEWHTLNMLLMQTSSAAWFICSCFNISQVPKRRSIQPLFSSRYANYCRCILLYPFRVIRLLLLFLPLPAGLSPHTVTVCCCGRTSYCQFHRVFCQYVQLSVAVSKFESCQFEPGLLLNVGMEVGVGWWRHSISGQL
jgi:hypothetical protein